jgi:hypothetical protein
MISRLDGTWRAAVGRDDQRRDRRERRGLFGSALSAVSALYVVDRGQAFTEYTMMLGLLAAMIIALTGLIVPAIGKIVVTFVQHVAIYVSSI